MMMMARSANASTRERGLLLQVLNRRDGVTLVESRDTDALTMARKNALWDEVTQEFNSASGSAVPRSRVQIQTLYKNMKAKARKYQQRRAEIEASGVPVGVGMAVEPDAVSEALLQLLAETHEYQFLQIQNTVSDSGNSNCSSTSIEGGIKAEQVVHPRVEDQDLLVKEEPKDEQDSLQWDSSSHNPFAPETTLEEGSEPIHPLPPPIDPVNSNTNDPIPSPHIPLKRRYSSPGLVNSNIFNPPTVPSVEMPSVLGRSGMCSCPDLHKEMVEMARQEHKLKMKMLEEERSQREQEHKVRMTVLNLRRTLLSRRTKRLKPKPKVMPNGINDYNMGSSKEGDVETESRS